jgi:glycerol-3-phosphate dehydrogenase
MNREMMLSRIRDEPTRVWDVVVVGGGATGVGVAVDAAARGYDVVLLEQSDFGKGTSTRSTKLVHGGVRYLRQGNIPLVMDALRERGILRHNAPHLVNDREFVVPHYDWWEAPFYGVGLKVYDALAGKYGFGKSKILSREETVARLPTIETEGLRGGVVYHDGQFDDARLLIHLAQTAYEQGGALVNYARVEGLLKDDDGFVCGVAVRDMEALGDPSEDSDHASEASFEIRSRAVVNATGVFTDSVRRMDDAQASPMIQPSQGVHVVLPARFLPGESAVMVPHTDDGRILFAVPWHGCVIVGTTDTPVAEAVLEPRAFDEEVDFILTHAARYLTEDPTEKDVLSVFAGLRPLVGGGDDSDTASLSRDHTLQVSSSGLVTIAGGKWTTYRKMAEDTVDTVATVAGLDLVACPTSDLHIHGYTLNAERYGPLAPHGSDAVEIGTMVNAEPGLGDLLHERLPYVRAEVVWAARQEMARTVEDVLARRTRALLLNARAAAEAAGEVARILAGELGRDTVWQAAQASQFRELAAEYMLGPPA